jgi:hypothetical protein
MLLRSLSRSVTKQNEDKRVKQQMAEAIARYEGPITKYPPARARGTEPSSEGLELLEQPRGLASAERANGRSHHARAAVGLA